MKAVIPVVFLLLAAAFLLNASPGQADLPGTPEFDRQLLQVGSNRDAMSDPPYAIQAGLQMTCAECHGLFDSKPGSGRSEHKQHGHISLSHGMNNSCYGCHSQQDRNKLILKGDEEIAYADTPLLCASCHGTTFRDWERGMHGRTNGFWDKERGPQVRQTCTQCHDPHSPAFAPLAPLPGPNTRLMGEPVDQDAHHGGHHNPLDLSGLKHAWEAQNHE